MINKNLNNHDISFDVDGGNVPKDVLMSFIHDFEAIQKKKYEGTNMNESTIYAMEYDIRKLMHDPKYKDISINNKQFYQEKYWALEKILKEYEKHFPERFEQKKEYTNIEVNNMLFDLHNAGVIGGYASPAVSADIPTYYNKIFDNDKEVLVEVPIIRIVRE